VKKVKGLTQGSRNTIENNYFGEKKFELEFTNNSLREKLTSLEKLVLRHTIPRLTTLRRNFPSLRRIEKVNLFQKTLTSKNSPLKNYPDEECSAKEFSAFIRKSRDSFPRSNTEFFEIRN
jgi:hypothetical protein